MKVIVCENYEEESQKAFEVMKDVIQKNPHAILGLATGSSPEGLYKEMVKDYEENGTSYADITSYNLDEYVGIDRNHPESYYSFMHKHLFDHVNIKPENTHLPEGSTQADADAYEAELKKVTIDLQLLGIGRNGHIGFNEPGTSFDSHTHKVALKESTIKDNARLFFNGDEDAVPHYAVTMGIRDILDAKKIILIACGARKAKAVAALVKGPVTTDCPASVLQTHPDVLIVIDEEAAQLLK